VKGPQGIERIHHALKVALIVAALALWARVGHA
jgi:hypothetical protein